ncbi:uncharacterized, partial [Tachysurus ichikawai]
MLFKDTQALYNRLLDRVGGSAERQSLGVGYMLISRPSRRLDAAIVPFIRSSHRPALVALHGG